MHTTLLRLLMPFAVVFSVLTNPVRADHVLPSVTIGTGGVTGVYYAAGGAICRLMSKQRSHHGLRCAVESTGGSVYNLNAVRAAELDFGIVQSDWQYHALQGTRLFEGAGPFSDLRAVFSLHPEPFTVVARKEAGIRSMEDLKGKRVNIGNPGSGHRASFEEWMHEAGWTPAVFGGVFELRADEHGSAVCENQIDAFIFGAGHPSANIQHPTLQCGARLIPFTGKAVDALTAQHPYYAKVTIPGGVYAHNPDPVPSYGVLASLVTSAKTPETTVYTLVKAVFENLNEFKRMHPAFAHLDPSAMIRDGLSAPFHEGALRYYRERGWVD
jgi:uncharacterized protein